MAEGEGVVVVVDANVGANVLDLRKGRKKTNTCVNP